MDLSVMFFGAESTMAPADKYEDILAIARTADELGFKAVWTPERHFQDFGQVFPSPAVLGAALAVSTSRIDIRAGSVVLPLHHPLRVAEEWSVVDNLSRGRVGLSVATGWHSTDFVLAPDHYADRRERALSDIALLRRLWAGEAVEFPDGIGEPVAVRPQPVPASRELPIWLTTSGNPETWAAAGTLQTGILAASIGQTRDELADKIRRYREAHRAAPAPAAGGAQNVVTLMMHAYVGDSDAAVRQHVRAPLQSYLRSFVRQISSNKVGATEAAMAKMSERDHAMLVEFAFERYLAWGSLLGSPQRCLDTMADLRELGVDEIACFVDFGLERDEVLKSLHRLSELRASLD
ncbi:MupA/Atu3671 family FMN-dependent luciferase-like monooxygenase [Kitasatospora sp. GP82]|uniref:MupA/Atu3671 family FMN-dependent luciferase-like monooxygenase n=1 Tax=Kitasatospora sp. GP82 TaxID=3035089 RepID=UPI0024768582|nr:MupA/Atu3671 family FMN-dependent luciferase-like monooxygenase [Kitasatospora sp. GP82]MDH6128761.1 natural product biosynthesis luciferase-like monooxygenase protein [Kitasatospora sp. GP82]